MRMSVSKPLKSLQELEDRLQIISVSLGSLELMVQNFQKLNRQTETGKQG